MENGIRFDLEYETMPWHRVDAVVFDIGISSTTDRIS